MEKPVDCTAIKCIEKEDESKKSQGVLLSDAIEYYATNYDLITPFKKENLKPGGIRLCLGREYSIGGELKELSDEPDKKYLTIQPFQVAIISTAETINLPRFLIARWNLRVSLVYQGLLWTGALQVDPGWCGPLHCPIYNLSSEPVVISLGEPIVLMDFVKTSDFIKEKSLEYPRPSKRKTLKDYNYKLKSALFTEAAGRVEQLENRIDKEFEKRVNRIESLTGLMIASIAILFAALSILVTSRDINLSQNVTIHPWFIVWTSVSICISIIALYFSISKTPTNKLIKAIILTICFVIIFSLIYLALPSINTVFQSILKACIS